MEAQVDVNNADVVPREGSYKETLEAIVAGGFCPFCEEHLLKHHTKPIWYTTKHWIVTENAWPYKGTRFHLLFIARSHVTRLEELSATAILDLHDIYRREVEERLITGATFMIRSGKTALTGATVNHLHVQVIVGNTPKTVTSKPIRALIGFKK